MAIGRLLDVGPEVAEALAAGRPVVALESTIITHGMPFPQNLETAPMLEETVRAQRRGAGDHRGHRRAFQGRARPRDARASGAALRRRRQGVATRSFRGAARGGAAGTTVAATMFVAALAGIEMFATGGIGGVHRGAEETFDISADLIELSRTRVAVVCAGAKSILDIAKTLEFLESQGVPVIGYRCDEFPAFFARSSGVQLDHRCDGAHDLARMVRLQQRDRAGRPADRQSDPRNRTRSTPPRSRRGSTRRWTRPRRRASARRR